LQSIGFCSKSHPKKLLNPISTISMLRMGKKLKEFVQHKPSEKTKKRRKTNQEQKY